MNVTFEQGTYFPQADGPLSVELSQDDFHVEKGQGSQDQHQYVGDEEGSTSILKFISLSTDNLEEIRTNDCN